MNLSKIAVHRPVAIMMLFMSVLLLGLVSLERLPVQFIPDISGPWMGVWLRYARPMGTEAFERQVIEPIEAEIAQLAGVRNMWVFSRAGSRAFFRIQFEFGTNAKFRTIELQEKLDRFRRTFPRGMLMLGAFPFDSSWENRRFMGVAIQGPRDDPYLQGINVDRVAQKLSEIDGVAQADTWGGHSAIIEVGVDEHSTREFNQPLYQITNTVRSYAAEPIFVGDLQENGQRYFVRVDGQFKTNQELADVTLDSEAGLFLKHVADVDDRLLTRNRLNRVNGMPSVYYTLEKESEVNPIALSRRVRKAMDDLMQNRNIMPPGYSLTVSYDASEAILELIRQLSRLAAFGVVLAMIILHLFVRSFRMTLMVCLVIPISIIGTFNLMYFSDMSINMITLVGLAIGVGTLLDNSIVVLENIARHRQRGLKAGDAAAAGAQEVTRPIFALTLTSIIVFVPVIFLKGEIQLVLREGALAVVYPLLTSMAVALLFVPMAAAYLFKHTDRYRRRKKNAQESAAPPKPAYDRVGMGGSWQVATGMQNLRKRATFARFRAGYLSLLKGCLRHRVRLLLVIVTVILYTWFYTMAEVNRGGKLQPPEDYGWMTVYVFPPSGTTLEHTTAIVDKVEDLIAELVPERKVTHSRIEDDDARVEVELVKEKDRDRTLAQIKESLRKPFEEITEADVSFEYKRARGSSTPTLVVSGQRGSIEILGPNQESLTRIINTILPIVEQVDGVRDAYSDIQDDDDLELQFTLDRDKGNLLQITPQSLAWQVSAAQSQGDVSQIRMTRDDEDIDIVFQQITDVTEERGEVLKWREGLRLAEMREIPIFSAQMGDTVPLEDLGSFELVRGEDFIFRQNQQRLARIIYSLAPTAKFQEVEESIKAITENFPLPGGFSFGYGGRSREFEEMLAAMRQMLWLAVLLVYMLMAALFESFTQPIVILLTIVLAFVPMVWGLLLTGTEFGEMAVFGILFLVGLLPNSGILLVNFASAMRREKRFPRARAIILACAYRLRPIFMTVGTTVLGLLPMAIKTEGGADWVPFAVVVISALIGSTILTLLIIPGFYFSLEDSASLVSRSIRYVLSWRWILVFWSKKKRTRFRERVTQYRRQEPRPEPLEVITWNLTRIYERPVLLRVQEAAARYAGGLMPLRPAPVGLLPGAQPARPEPEAHGTVRRRKALAGVNLEIGRGLFGLLGPNGAGKTTLMRLLVGIDQPTRGSCRVCGYDIVKESDKARRSIGYLPQDFGVYGERTAREYLNHFALLKGMKEKKARRIAIDRALEMVNLRDAADVGVGGFSGGMTRRVGLAQIFLQPPRVLIVDEPTAGLDPLERLRFRNLLMQLAADRIVVLSTHIVEDVAQSCQNLAVLQNGEITFQGAQDELIDLARGRVAEIVSDDEHCLDARRHGEVTTMQRTADGLRMRLVCWRALPPGSQAVEPALEDAYVYHTGSESTFH